MPLERSKTEGSNTLTKHLSKNSCSLNNSAQENEKLYQMKMNNKFKKKTKQKNPNSIKPQHSIQIKL